MPRIVRTIGRVWDRVELVVGGLFLTVSVLLIVIQIVCRVFFSVSLVGADEIAAYAIIWSILFTASLAVKSNQHVRIDIIFTIVPRYAARLVDMVGTALSLVFTLYLTYSGWELMMESYLLGELTMTMLRMPIWIPQIILPLGGMLLSLRLIQRFIWLVYGGVGAEDEQRDSEVTSPL